MKYLMLFTISPVQSFISQARKAEDLYAGSFLLSNLIESTMEYLSKELKNNYMYIFPDIDIESKPNRFIAIIDTENVSVLGKKLENYIQAKFMQLALETLHSSNISYTGDFSNTFLLQIKDHIKVNWIAVPLNNDDITDVYKNVYLQATKFLAAIKSVRHFKQLSEVGRKCSLCGERNVLFYRLTDKEIEKGGLKKRNYDNLLNKLYTSEEKVIIVDETNEKMSLKIQKGEGLCAVCYTKRFYKKPLKFPSTAEIAIAEWIQKIPKDHRDIYKKLFRNFDTQLYYIENLNEKILKKNNNYVDNNSLNKAKKMLKSFYEIIDEDGEKIGEPPRYYGLIKFDGDSMGEWISGKYLNNDTELLDFHREISSKLGNFSKLVRKIVIDTKGKIVYAGGDDVLGFVNLKYLFPIIQKLRNNFPAFEELGFSIEPGNKSSASCGVVIAHYKTPLSEVLKYVRIMEKEAKLIDKAKDSFAIAILKRSGGIKKVILKWKYEDVGIIELIQKILNFLTTKRFSSNFIKGLELEFKTLIDENGLYNEKSIVKTEIKRLVSRSCLIEKNENEKQEEFLKRRESEINDLTETLTTLYDKVHRLGKFLSILDIVDFIARRGVFYDNRT